VDFVVGDDGQPDAVTLLEVNTLPGMTGTSLFPEAAARSGLTMPDLCASLVAQAHARLEVELTARDKSRAEPLPL
jgi:D-alanine-D-alanine ligase